MFFWANLHWWGMEDLILDVGSYSCRLKEMTCFHHRIFRAFQSTDSGRKSGSDSCNGKTQTDFI